MNLKSINSKLDFLENLIVEMNPDNLEELKSLCFEKISEINYYLIIFERSKYIAAHTSLNIDTAFSVAKVEHNLRGLIGNEFDVVPLMNISPTLGNFHDLELRLSLKNTLAGLDLPRIGDSLKLEFENPKVVYDKPESKYFTKPKNNFKIR